MAERAHQLPDELVQELLNAIERTGEVYARAKAKLEVHREKRKIMKATMMKMAEASGIGSHQRQERDAYSHPSYITHIDQLYQLIDEEVTAEIKFRNAEREFDAWRTISANARAVGR